MNFFTSKQRDIAVQSNVSLSYSMLIFCCDKWLRIGVFTMKDTIIKLFNLEPSELHDVEIVSTDHTVYAIITLNVRHQIMQ